jgi:PhnB protein
MKETIFNTDATNNKIMVERAFDADIDLVWQAWTDPAILDDWWAPHPWKTVTKSMDFREGGRWLYYMQGPAGEKHWCKVDYLQIEDLRKFDAQDSFCDEYGNKLNTAPSMHWENTFTSTGNGTKVNALISFASKEDLETIIKMGFKEGFAAAHKNLDEFLKQQVKLKA